MKFAMINRVTDILSKEAVRWLIEHDSNVEHLKNIDINAVYKYFDVHEIYPIHSPILVACIEDLGEAAFDSNSPKMSPRILDIEVTDKYLLESCNGRRRILPMESMNFKSISSQPNYDSLNSRTTIFSKAGNLMVLNPNSETVNHIYIRLEKRNGHCPCTIEENEDTLCPCKDVRINGKCHCGLYIDVNTTLTKL
jgi:hypothetical protein